jgi:hypothetical protein
VLGLTCEHDYDRYGHEASGEHDRFTSALEEALILVTAALLPGAYLVNVIPVSGPKLSTLLYTYYMALLPALFVTLIIPSLTSLT